MNIEEKAKAYDEALERAKELIAKWTGKNKDFYIEDYSYIFPELRKSEDEKIRKWLVDYFSSIKETVWIHRDITCEQILEWLKKQEGNQYFVGYAKGYSEGQLNPKPKEQKPVDDSDFKTKLAEYMTKNSTGYSYNISSESILQMAKEELLKRGELKEQKPAWSEEDEILRVRTINRLETLNFHGISGKEIRESIDWLKSLRPPFKPSEEQMEALMLAIEGKCSPTSYMSRRLEDLYDGLANTYGIDAEPEYYQHFDPDC